MKKVLFLLSFLVCLNANEQNSVKTSELELFLFKVGFESLLKDVEITKDKSELNSDEILRINDKINLIMDELYKNNRVLENDSQEKVSATTSKELEELRSEIAFLKKEINSLKTYKPVVKEEIVKEPKIVVKEVSLQKEAVVAKDKIFVYSRAYDSSKIIKELYRGDKVSIQFCTKYGWCKLGENQYIKKHLIKFK